MSLRINILNFENQFVKHTWSVFCGIFNWEPAVSVCCSLISFLLRCGSHLPFELLLWFVFAWILMCKGQKRDLSLAYILKFPALKLLVLSFLLQRLFVSGESPLCLLFSSFKLYVCCAPISCAITSFSLWWCLAFLLFLKQISSFGRLLTF